MYRRIKRGSRGLCGVPGLSRNRPFKQWGTIMNQDNTLAAALIDRLGHHAEGLVIEGKSYRMKGKEKEEDVKTEKK